MQKWIEATDALGGADPKLLVVFSSDAYDLEQLLAGIAGLLSAPSPGQSLSVDAGVILGLKGVTAALLGGLDQRPMPTPVITSNAAATALLNF